MKFDFVTKINRGLLKQNLFFLYREKMLKTQCPQLLCKVQSNLVRLNTKRSNPEFTYITKGLLIN